MKISLIHPSKGRPYQAALTFRKWMDNASGKYEIEYILGLDDNDATVDQYVGLFQPPIQLAITNSRSCVQAANAAAKLSSGDILVLVSDDFECPKDWDVILADAMPLNKKAAIQVDDGITNFAELLTIPIINRLMYEHLGYIYHPAFSNMFADNHLYDVCKKHIIKVKEVFQHNHYVNGMRKKDAVDQAHGGEKQYLEGKKIYESLR
jgi:hypothetical protein